MLQLSLNVTVDRTWYGVRRGVSLSAELTAAEESSVSDAGAIPISLFLEQLARAAPELMPTLSSADTQSEGSGNTVRDVRGRPAESFSTSSFKSSVDSPTESLRRLQEEELFYTRGALLPIPSIAPQQLESVPNVLFDPDSSELDSSDAIAEGDIDAETPFIIRVHSRFDSFDGAHIAHRLVRTISPILDEVTPSLSVRLLSRLIPARLDMVRLGVENFKPRRFSGMLGFVPTVTDRLFLEITRSSIRIVSQADLRGGGSKERGTLPLSEQILLEKVDESLRSTGLFPNLLEKIRTALEN